MSSQILKNNLIQSLGAVFFGWGTGIAEIICMFPKACSRLLSVALAETGPTRIDARDMGCAPPTPPGAARWPLCSTGASHAIVARFARGHFAPLIFNTNIAPDRWAVREGVLP